MTRSRLLASASVLALALALSGCTYDYLQNSDQAGYHAGDAVKANLISQTVNPTKSSMYDKSRLGKDGNVVPAESPPASNP